MTKHEAARQGATTTMTSTTTTMSDAHLGELKAAKMLLEKPSLMAKISGVIGSPIENVMKLLPDATKERIVGITTAALETSLNAAVYSLGDEAAKTPRKGLHKLGVAVSGAAGGAMGLAALAWELPVSTTLMLRSIADIARNEGEDLSHREAQLACLSVFALGGPSKLDDAADTGYFGIRAGLAKAISDASKHIVRHGLSAKGAPVLSKFMSAIATRFSIPVSEKVAAQSVPIIGAAGGVLVNTVFIQHFQDIAQGHFTVRRLERIYGSALVREQYEKLS